MEEKLKQQTYIYEQVLRRIKERKKDIQDLEKKLEDSRKALSYLEYAKKVEENILKKIIKEYENEKEIC